MSSLRMLIEAEIGSFNSGAILNSVFVGFRRADELLRGLSLAVRIDNSGSLRRGLIMEEIYGVAQNIPDASTSLVRSKALDRWHHLEIETPSFVIVPALDVPAFDWGASSSFPRRGYLRELSRRLSPSFFQGGGRQILVVLYQSLPFAQSYRHPETANLPARVTLCLLSQDLTVSDKLNMMEAYPHVVRQNLPVQLDEDVFLDYVKHGIIRRSA